MEGEYEINGELEWQFESLMEFFGKEVAENLVKKQGWSIGLMPDSKSEDAEEQKLIDEYFPILSDELEGPLTDEHQFAYEQNEYIIWTLRKGEHEVYISGRFWQHSVAKVRDIDTLVVQISNDFPQDILDYLRVNSPFSIGSYASV